jgi:hypothetical protein
MSLEKKPLGGFVAVNAGPRNPAVASEIVVLGFSRNLVSSPDAHAEIASIAGLSFTLPPRTCANRMLRLRRSFNQDATNRPYIGRLPPFCSAGIDPKFR